MPTKKPRARRPAGGSGIQKQTASFFAALEEDAFGKQILAEQNHRIEFDLTDGKPFYIEILHHRVVMKSGSCQPKRYDSPDLIHFQLKAATLRHLLAGEIRFTDALIPTDPKGRHQIVLLECGLFKWSVLNWVGRLFRAGQLPRRFRD
jgi:hypothetical protein